MNFLISIKFFVLKIYNKINIDKKKKMRIHSCDETSHVLTRRNTKKKKKKKEI